jgi:putative transport protein
MELMQMLTDFLASSPLLLLFAVIGLGYLVGSISVFGFSLGPAAVLFAGIFFGSLDQRLRIPDLIYILGLILFVYTVGLQSGPTFFASFGRRVFRANLFAFAAVVISALLAAAAAGIFNLDGASLVGVFCGALTNTPALASGVETIKALLQNQSAQSDVAAFMVNAPVIGYSVSYPFGVIGVLLGFTIYGKLRRPAPGRREEAAEIVPGQPVGPISAKTFRVVNPGIIGKTVSATLSLHPDSGFVLSRLRRGENTSLVYGDTAFEKGDLVVAVGDGPALERAAAFFGEEASKQIQTENEEFDYRRIEVSDRKVVGKTIASLDIQNMLDATITRVRRGDVDFVPTGETTLERGDRVRVVTWVGNMDRIIKFFGDSIRSGTETDFLSLSLGIVLGILLGMAPLPLPGGSSFTLGFAGGPLIAGMVLGRMQRSGPITWTMPFAVNLSLRQVGLVLFLAGIGTKAGDGFLTTVATGGWKLMTVGAIITLTETALVLMLGSRALGLNYQAVMGLMSGIQTQPACLAYANAKSSSNAPDVWYASVYPLSMISKIVLAQLLVGWLL